MLQKKIAYPLIFITTVLIYTIFIARNGYEDWDTGFISGMAWRLVKGEVMYRDFIYTKTPFSPYYTATLMRLLPQEGQFYFIKCINSIVFALQVCLTVLAINNIYNLKKYGINVWGFVTVGFIISLLNYPMYPWYTPDGLFFASAALYVKSRNSKSYASLLFIALLVLLSALCKQSYYPVPIIFLVWVFIDYGFKKAAAFLGIFLLLTGVFIGIITRVTSLHNFLDCITGQTRLYDVYYSCIYGYAHKNYKLYLLIIAASILIGINYKSVKQTSFTVIFKWLIICQFVAAIILYCIGEAQLGSIIAFNSCALAGIYNIFVLKREISYLYPAAALLGIAWCSSVSWGYPYPTLFASAIIAVYFILSDGFLSQKIVSKKNILAVVMCIVAFAYNLYPYRSGVVTDLDYDMGAISPKLKYIRTNKENFDKFLQLKELIDKYGPVYITATHYPGTYYIFDKTNPLTAGWMINSEINFKLDKMLAEAANSNGYIFLDNEYKPIFDAGEAEASNKTLFSAYIAENCTPIEKLRYFTVYDTKELNKKLPETDKNRAIH
ncbi:hypothetical protein R1T16_06750 [Flavobacterium sp. DG1-102-2]|uniref:hypothetical protein n=1 Tax=Flavobacterium sp. DG1-102-2 TaxID=3081663 RepID=UPI002948DAF6|nr:hypothetical protein [Flavobacterium sp. DG1-102-2]MDV6168118.1 hypothetical protein [Flavobacterium sp. DG1-102-2]